MSITPQFNRLLFNDVDSIEKYKESVQESLNELIVDDQ